MKQLLSMFAIAMLMVACGESKTAQTEEVVVEEVVLDSTTLEGNFDDDSIEQLEEVPAEGEEASAE
jgi:uncharacterized protein YcfL